MTVTLIDPPVGELPSSTTPVRFSVTNLVGLVIGVAHSDAEVSRPREFAYADGAFLYPYLGSTFNAVGNVFSILRDGGWAAFEETNDIVVIEQPPVPSSGLGWEPIYQLDLTTQPSQTMTAAGSYTIDGKVWWAKGTLWGSGINGLVNGSGLRLFGPASVGGSQPDRPNFRTVTSGILQRVLFFPFDAIADYNANAPVYVLWRMSGTISGDSDRCYSAGMMSAAKSAAPLTDAERGLCAQVCHHTKNNANPIFAGVAGAQTPTSPLIDDANLADYQTGVLRFAKQRFYVIGAPYSGTEVDPESSAMNLSGGGCLIETGAQNALGLYFTLHKAFSDGQTLDVYLTHLTVAQPKVT